MIESTPRFVQGIYAFTGAGYDQPLPLAGCTVSADRRAQLMYFRAGNSTDALAVLSVTCNGALMRLFPIGARSSEHVSLAVVEDIFPESRLEVLIAAPAGVEGTVALDFGLVEVGA